MKRSVVSEQVLMVRIESPSWVAIGHGFSDTIPGKEWYVGEFTTQGEADAMLEKAKREYRILAENGSWMKAPEMKIEWETISKTIIPK